MSVHGEAVCPEAVLASIAWYPDQLDEERRGLVEAHAAGCPACRDELAFVQGESEPELALPDPEAVYARVLARIERSEGRARGGARREVSRARPPMREHAVSRRAALAAGIALALAVGTIGVVSGRWLERASLPYYTAAGDAGATAGTAAPASGPVLEVVFHAEATADSVHSALRAIGGQVESGPTQLGVYRVRLGPAADAAAAARVLRGDVGGGGQGVASFAEPAPR
jgi:hypothetical protein